MFLSESLVISETNDDFLRICCHIESLLTIDEAIEFKITHKLWLKQVKNCTMSYMNTQGFLYRTERKEGSFIKYYGE